MRWRRLLSRSAATPFQRTLDAGEASDQPPGLLKAFGAMVAGDFARWRMSRELKRRWREIPGRPRLDDRTLKEAVDLATREMALDQQVRLLQRTHRIFRYWHLLHRPIALTALVAVVIHIGVVVAVGATWFW